MKLKLSYVEGVKHPVAGEVLYSRREISGENSSEVQRYKKFLADTLPFLASNPNDCEDILKKINRVAEKEVEEFEIEGEDVEAIIRMPTVQIDILLDDHLIDNPDGRFSLSEFQNAVFAWREFLEMPKSKNSLVVREL
ncbi:hypothetical protein [Marinobacter sp. BGYM27]|uniref:hypothetical protein n=1 Tax=Marinobacter sp. BGYM27 TaxID=2975597 RepID=UPI0021A3F26B|nr:hypothetical protein [Marinobacter sp. BGYM27]MDG5500888.1 hypothetical protein [Marinobacter sp. BGYM27]